MNKLEFDGIIGAGNAFAVGDDGRYAYFSDPRADCIIRIDLTNGERVVLKWYDKSFHHPRWLCYTMFTMHRDNATYLPMLFYNKKRKSFLLITFLLDAQKFVLYKVQENIVDVEPVRSERFSYSAHKDESKLHMIFYDRFERHHMRSGSSQIEEQNPALPCVYCCFNCHTLRLTTKKTTLPAGQWELPFIAHGSLHFVSTAQSTMEIASISVESEMESSSWNIRPVATDLHETVPPRKATWVNAFRAGMGWYIVCEKNVQDFESSRCITLWQLDVLDCRWRKLPTSVNTTTTAKNFALQVDLRNNAVLHFDWDRGAALYKMNLDELMLQREDNAVAASEEFPDEQELFVLDEKDESNCADLSNSEIICPICLDTYDDPRTLTCGHSVCNSCIEQMKAAAQSSTIRCFACRKATTIPSTGLPVNFGLRDAIEALQKVRQLSFLNLRCAHCRKLCEEADLWICLECVMEDADLISEEIADSVTDGHKKFLFCAQCILKYHNIHKVDELSQFRERYKAGKEANLKSKAKTDELLKEFRIRMAKKLESGLFEPLKSDVHRELRQMFNSTAYDANAEPKSDDEIVERFEQRLDRMLDNIDTQFEILLKTNWRRLSRYEGPTEL